MRATLGAWACRPARGQAPMLEADTDPGAGEPALRREHRRDGYALDGLPARRAGPDPRAHAERRRGLSCDPHRRDLGDRTPIRRPAMVAALRDATGPPAPAGPARTHRGARRAYRGAAATRAEPPGAVEMRAGGAPAVEATLPRGRDPDQRRRQLRGVPAPVFQLQTMGHPGRADLRQHGLRLSRRDRRATGIPRVLRGLPGGRRLFPV